MTSATNLKDLEDSLKDLSNELHQNFSLMLDLGSRSKKLMGDVDKIADSYMSNFKKNSAEKKKSTMETIRCKFDAAKQLSDEKVNLAVQTYELVDKRIRRLDLEIAQFEAEMKLKAEIRDTIFGSTRNLKQKRGTKLTKSAFSASAVADLPNSINSVADVVKTNSLTGTLVDTGVVHSADADMPIDPNEPKYCLCNQVSFGEMIGCDDPDCAIEWFHFACVNLITKPKGKWFCPKCTKDKKKK